MERFLAWLASNGTRILPVSLFVGLAWADLAALLRPALLPTVFFMLTMLMIRVDIGATKRHLASPLAPVLGLLWMLLAVPVIFAAGIFVSGTLLSEGLVLALIFWASAPTLFSTPALAYLLRLDPALSLGLLLAAVALHPIVTPFFTVLFTDGSISVSPMKLVWRLLALVAGSAFVAVMVRRWLGQQKLSTAGPIFDGLNVVGLVIFAIAIMDGITARLLADPYFALAIIAFVSTLSLAVIGLTMLVFWKFGRQFACTVSFSAGGRNIALVIGALGSAVPPDTWLFFAVLQFPIYCLPVILKPVYDRLIPDQDGTTQPS